MQVESYPAQLLHHTLQHGTMIPGKRKPRQKIFTVFIS